MRTIIVSLDNWPMNKSGEYIFQDTPQALYFANIAFGKPGVIANLKRVKSLARKALQIDRKAGFPNSQRTMQLSLKSQLYRECLEEIDRIKKEGP